MPERVRFWRRWRVELAAAVLLLVPVLALLLAGAAWLLQQGWMLWWLGGAVLAAVLAWGGLRLRHGRARAPAADEPTVTAPGATWAADELTAWEAVRRESAEADGSALDHRRRMLAAAQRTIEAVAQRYHPGRTAPVLEFTLPELLLLTERVSARLRLVLLEQVPLSHRIKAAHLVRAWGYGPALSAGLEHGRRIYGVMRFARLANPLYALVAEFRDHLLDDLFATLQAGARRRVVRIWIEEIGRAAIELYSGRLRVDAADLAAIAASEGLGGAAAAAEPPGLLRVLVAGRTKAGKSALVNGLLGELSAGMDVLPLTSGFEGYELRHEGVPAASVIDSPGVDDARGVTGLVERAFACDLVVWVVPAHRPDRALDRAALEALRGRFAADPQRKMPPLVVVASHIDRLSPLREWAPPYNVDAPTVPKARSIRAALEAIAEDLPVPVETIVPMRLDSVPPYNLELLWMRLEAAVPEAKRAHWVRLLQSALGQSRWRRSWQQLAGAGRMVGSFVKR